MGNLATADLVVLLAYLAGSVALGLWVGRRSKTVADYVVGGRSLPWLVVLLSIVATETSTVSFLSVPGKGFSGDLTFLQLALGYVVGRFLVVLLILPALFRGQPLTVYEVLGRAFGPGVKRATSLLFVATRSAADGLRLYLTALVLHQVMDLDLALCVLVIGVVTIVYTFVGGMKAVAWMDTVQFLVYVGGAMLAFRLLLEQIPGGLDEVVRTARQAGKLRVFDLDLLSPTFVVAGVLGGVFLTLATHGADQMMVQRYLCARSRRQASVSLALSGFVVLAQFALFLAIGLGLYTFFQLRPPAAPFDKPDEVFAHFMVHHLGAGTGILGVILGAVFSAAMSTLSSSLNSSASAAVNDLYLPWKGASLEDPGTLRVTRRLTVFFGLVQMGVALGGRSLDQTVVDGVLGIAGLSTGVVLGLFFLGLFVPRAGPREAMAALAVGLCAMLWVRFGTDLHWFWYAPLGSLGTLCVGAVLAAFLGSPPPADPRTCGPAPLTGRSRLG